MEILPVLHNIRSVGNVGAILRTAEGFGVQRVLLSGYTPRPHDPHLLPHLRDKLDRQFAKTALGAENWVNCEFCRNLPARLHKLQADGWTLSGLENNLAVNELPRRRLLPELSASELGERVVLVLGEEVHGIPPEIRQALTLFLEIPMQGRKESFNVSVAAGIALYALTAAH